MSLETPTSDTADGSLPADAEPVLVGADSDVTPTVSIVMPTMNEEAGIEECLRKARSALEELGVTGEIVVSDSSDDRTPEIAAAFGARVVEPERSGYGAAYQYAFERCRGDYIVMGDADTTYDFEELPKLFAPVAEGEADLVLGSRLDGEIKPGAMPALHQYIGNPALTAFLNVFYDVGVSDAHSGFRVFTRETIESLELRSDGMEFASEMIMVAGVEGFTIEEVPITYHEREGEATLDSFRDGWRHVKFMLVNAPGYLFSIPGLVMGIVGLVLLTLGYSDILINGQPIGVNSLIAGSLLMLVGYQVGSFGLLTTVVADPIQKPGDPITNWVHKHFTLERGTLLGLATLAAGAAIAAFLVYRWFESGFTVLPTVETDIVAATLILLGIQTVYISFFANIVGSAVGE
ncbi:glycosyltransferase family 2 protein [Halosimplex halophilum]|uniref:glycosyltransferase family 2 protein n=1 Tax=Halosimplex halophilum TaxID=2559572 RepID=UPI00107F1735|nr:glycosyltransferase family 2 protein [Halosimplex halophilum]